MKIFFILIAVIFTTTIVFSANWLVREGFIATNDQIESYFDKSNAIYWFTCDGLLYTNPSGNPKNVQDRLNNSMFRQFMIENISNLNIEIAALKTLTNDLTITSKQITKDINTATNLIQRCSVDVCRVYGHTWVDGRPGETNGFIYADYHPNIRYRTCRTCGNCQSQKTDEWK